MKIRNVLGALLFLVSGFISCEDNSLSEKERNRLPVQFTSGIDGEIQSRVTGTKWDSGDAIGIFMKRNGQLLSAATILEDADNLEYTAGEKGMFIPAAFRWIYYPADGSKVDFIAYYPYQENLTDYIYKVDLAHQPTASSVDLLYADGAKGLAMGEERVTLSFSHQLSRVILNITAGEGIKDLTGLNVVFSGLKTKADFALAEGTLVIDDRSVGEITVPLVSTETGKVGEAMVLPEADVKGAFIRFNLHSKSYDWKIPEGFTYEKGKRYTYDIVLKNGGAEEKPSLPTWFETPTGDMENTIYVTHYLPDRAGVRNYAMLYDTIQKLAYWVAYPLHASYVSSGRWDSWGYDPEIKPSLQPYLKNAFGISGIDRGHQIPSADRNYSRAGNATTFYYSNMTAQNSTLNQGMWAQLENRIRTWMRTCDTLYVVTGAMVTTDTDRNITYVKDNDKKNVAKPKYYFKALAQKVGNTYYTIGFKMDNKAPSNTDYNAYRMSVSELEAETGFTFFPELTDAVKAKIETSRWN